MDDKLEVGRRQPEGEPGVITNRKGLVELKGESLNEGSIGGGRNGGVSRYKGDGAFIIDEDLEGNREVGVSFAEGRGGEVWLADLDKGFVRGGGLNSAGGIEPSGRAGERRRALGGGGLNDVCDFNSGSARRLSLRLGLAFVPHCAFSGGLI